MAAIRAVSIWVTSAVAVVRSARDRGGRPRQRPGRDSGAWRSARQVAWRGARHTDHRRWATCLVVAPAAAFVGRAAEIELFRACRRRVARRSRCCSCTVPGVSASRACWTALREAAHEPRRGSSGSTPAICPPGRPRGAGREALAGAISAGPLPRAHGRAAGLLRAAGGAGRLDPDDLLPDLPANVVTVLAGRCRPPGWRPTRRGGTSFRVVALRT